MLKNCQHLIGSFRSAVWDDKKNEDKRLDNFSYEVDPLDAFEYAIEPMKNQLQAAANAAEISKPRLEGALL